MDIIATICMVPTKEGPKAIAISPTDDAWFVSIEDAPKELVEAAKELNRGTPNDVLGFVLKGEPK